MTKDLEIALLANYDEREAHQIAKYYFIDKWNGRSGFNDAELEEIKHDTNRLLQNEPLQYVTGKAFFYERMFGVNKHVLIPRPETEELVRLVIDDVKDRKDLSILDIGTGSGCIAISLAESLKHAKVSALDISPEALSIGRQNDNKRLVKFIESDILDEKKWPSLGHYDVVVSNPPYIGYEEKSTMAPNVLEYEPHLALFTENPCLFYYIIADYVSSFDHNSEVYLELNPIFADVIASYFIELNFIKVIIVNDMQGKKRILSAKWFADSN